MARRPKATGKLGKAFTDFVSATTIAEYLGTPVGYVYQIARDPTFPPAVMVNGTTKRWPTAWVDLWIYQNLAVTSGAPKREKPQAVVYFIRCGMNVKIGFAVDAHKRMAGLQTACPDRLELIHTIPGTMADERELHKRFAASRIRPDGEWFRLTDDILQFIGGAL